MISLQDNSRMDSVVVVVGGGWQWNGLSFFLVLCCQLHNNTQLGGLTTRVVEQHIQASTYPVSERCQKPAALPVWIPSMNETTLALGGTFQYLAEKDLTGEIQQCACH